MTPTAAKASTDCRITEGDLWQTTTRFDTILSERPCPHLHLSKIISESRPSANAYAIVDSRCHSGWQGCDKEEGDWLWIIARANRWIEQTVAVNYAVESIDPCLLKVHPDSLTLSLPREKLDSETPIYVFPFYAKRPRSYCDCRKVRLIRYPKEELCRAPLRISTDVRLIDNGGQHAREYGTTTVGVAIPPIDERIAHIEDALLKEYQAFAGLLKRFPISKRTESERVVIRHAWINICQHEVELGELLGKVAKISGVPVADADVLVNDLIDGISRLDPVEVERWPAEVLETLHELEAKLKAPGKAATAKLRITLPVVPLLVSYILELDSESALMQTWRKVKALFKKATHD